MRGALLLVLALVVAGCATPAARIEDAPVAKGLPDPIRMEFAVPAAGGTNITGEGYCSPNRPCFDVPFALPGAAIVRASASWDSPAHSVWIELRDAEGEIVSRFPDLGATSAEISRLLQAGEYLVRAHAYRMADAGFTVDVTFREAPDVLSAPPCDPSRPAVAHAGGARALPADAATLPTPCLHPLDAETVEPTIGIHPDTGAVFYYPAWPSVGEGGGRVARSLDGGATWEFLAATLAGNDMHSGTLDPYLYVDPATGRVFVDDLLTVNCSMISWSDDGGATWDHTPLGGCMEFDHQTIFAGPPALSPTVGYPNVVYRCAANTFALTGYSTTSTCQRSLDGGRTWLPPGEPAFGPRPTARGALGVPAYCDGLVGHGAVGPDGTVYLPKGWCVEPWLAISRDEGHTWTRTLVADIGFLSDAGWPAHDAGVGIDADGNIYYGWIAADRMPYVAVSRDGGATFEEPRMVAPPGVNEASHPELIAGGAGRIAFLYLGTTNSPREFTDVDCTADPSLCVIGPAPADYAETTWNAYVTVSLDADGPDPTYWTVTLNHPDDPLVRGHCGPVRCGAGHDFFDIRIGPDGTPWIAMGDSCIDACVSDREASGGNRAVVGRVLGVDLR